MGVSQSVEAQHELYVAPLSPLRLSELLIRSPRTAPSVRLTAPASAGEDIGVHGSATFVIDCTAPSPSARTLLLSIECGATVVLDFALAGPPGLLFGWAPERAQAGEGPLVAVEPGADGRWALEVPVSRTGAQHFAFLSQRRTVLAAFALHLETAVVPEMPLAPVSESSPQLGLGRRPPLPPRSMTSPPVERSTTPVLRGRHLSSPPPVGTTEAPSYDDGPLFRATLAELERKLDRLRRAVKRLVKGLETEVAARTALHEAERGMDEALAGMPAIGPLMDVHLAERREGEARRRQIELERLETVLDDVRRISGSLKTTEARKKAFDAESKTFYDHLAKYLAAGSEPAVQQHRHDEKHVARTARWAQARVEWRTALEDATLSEVDLLAIVTRDAQARAANTLASFCDTTSELDAFAAHQLGDAIADVEARRAAHVIARAAAETSCLASPSMPDLSLSRVSLDEPEAPLDRRHRIRSSLQILRLGEKKVVYGAQLSPSMSSPILPSAVDDFSDPTRKKEGYLWTAASSSASASESGSGGRSWQRRWVVLAAGTLTEYTGWREDGPMDVHGQPISLRFATVRRNGSSDRRFTFEVVTTSSRRTYQATSEDDARRWARAIANAIESLLNGTSSVRNFDASRLGPTTGLDGLGIASSPSTASLLEGIGLNQSPLARRVSGDRRRNGGSGERERETSAPGKLASSLSSFGLGPQRSQATLPPPPALNVTPAPVNREADDLAQRLEEAARWMDSSIGEPEPTPAMVELHQLARLPANRLCADCGRTEPRWASYNLGIFICVTCSGVHRSLGTHISKVRSLDLDDWTDRQVEPMRTIGNERALGLYGPCTPSDSDMTVFIRRKYSPAVPS